MDDDDFREAMVGRVQRWTGVDDPYNEVDELVADLRDAGWVIVESDSHETFADLAFAAEALAGAELTGAHREEVWSALEGFLADAYGDEWKRAARDSLHHLLRMLDLRQ